MAARSKKSGEQQNKAALYIRVSTKYQIDGDSLPMQREELPKYVQFALGIKSFEIFEDAGYSAKNTERPAYQSMMSRVRSGEFSHVVVWKMDRISRNLLDFAAMYAELKRLGVVFISKNEQFDTSTAIGEAMLKIILVFAELERNMTAERVSSIMINRSQNGLWNGGKIPFGYARNKETGEFTIIEDEAKTVLKIFELYEELHSLLKVATYLNEHHIRTRSGIPWNPTTVSIILKSPFYAGTYRYNFRDESKGASMKKSEKEWILMKDHHPAIIDEARQKAVLHTLTDNERSFGSRRTYVRKNVHIFAGLLTCGVCGSNYQATIDKPRAKNGWRPSIYLCSRHRRFDDCSNKYVSDVSIGPFVLNFLSNYIRAQRSFGRTTDKATLEKKLLRGEYFFGVSIDPDSLAAIHRMFTIDRFGIDEFATETAQIAPDEPSEREILVKERKRLERALERLKSLYLYSDDGMSEKDYITESSNLNASLSKIIERIDELDSKLVPSEDADLDTHFLEEASYLVITEELLSKRFVNYENVIRVLDKGIVKDFVKSVVKNFCILDGKISEMRLRNGLNIKFLYSAK